MKLWIFVFRAVSFNFGIYYKVRIFTENLLMARWTSDCSVGCSIRLISSWNLVDSKESVITNLCDKYYEDTQRIIKVQRKGTKKKQWVRLGHGVCMCAHACVCMYVCVCTHVHFHRKETLKSRSEILIELIQFDLVDNIGKGIPDKGNGMSRSFWRTK